jgi:hypothetical protein
MQLFQHGWEYFYILVVPRSGAPRNLRKFDTPGSISEVEAKSFRESFLERRLKGQTGAITKGAVRMTDRAQRRKAKR